MVILEAWAIRWLGWGNSSRSETVATWRHLLEVLDAAIRILQSAILQLCALSGYTGLE